MATLHRAPVVHLLPATRAGRWSLVLMLGLPVGYALFVLFIAQGQRGGETFLDASPWLTLSLFGGAFTSIAGGFVAAFAIIRRHERGILTALPILFAALVAVFLAAELGGHG